VAKPLKIVLSSSCESVPLKFEKKFTGPPVYFNRSNETSLTPQFKWLEYTFKGIDRPFELRGESRLIRSVMINWSLGYFFYLILKGHHHKISKKQFTPLNDL